LLEEIGALDAHRLPYHLEEIDDPERQRGLVRAQLAMAGVVDADQTVYTGRLRGGQLAGV
jgi:hypothetical protein